MERIKLAEKIISTCREMNASGLNQGTSGNVSARYTGGMLITPSGIAYSKMTPDMIVFVDDKGIPEAGKIPSSEWLFHLACYKARPELNAVIHNTQRSFSVSIILSRAHLRLIAVGRVLIRRS